MTLSDLHATGRHLQKCHSHQCDLCREHWGHDGRGCAAERIRICPTCADPLKIRLDDGRIVRLDDRAVTRVRWVTTCKAIIWLGSRQATVTRRLDRDKLLQWTLARVQGVN